MSQVPIVAVFAALVMSFAAGHMRGQEHPTAELREQIWCQHACDYREQYTVGVVGRLCVCTVDRVALPERTQT